MWRAVVVAACLLSTSLTAQNDAATRRAAIEGMYPIMLGALQAKNFGRARNICDQAIMWEPQNPVHHYNLACIEAQAGGARLPYAWGALELAIALGFDDAGHLQADPDLAPLRDDPKFADLVRKVNYNVTAGAAIDSIAIPAGGGKSTAAASPDAEVENPAPAGFINELPVGLYLMNRYDASTQTLEVSVWYFAPDHLVYRGLRAGFSTADLKAHAGRRGTARRAGHSLEISWSDGAKSTAELERDGAGFNWNMGIFTPVTAFENRSDVAGVYEGAEPMAPGSQEAPVTQRLVLRADGTFTWEGVSITATKAGETRVSAGNRKVADGRWELRGFSLILKNADEVLLRQMVLPLDDDETVIRPDRMFFGDLVYKRRP